MSTIRISEAEFTRDVHGALEKIRNGAEIVIERDHHPVAVIKALA